MPEPAGHLFQGSPRKKIKARAFNLAGELVEYEIEEMFSRVFQHENDHLDGKLFIDYLGALAMHSIKDKLREFETSIVRPSPAESTRAIARSSVSLMR